ncbi:MAG: hypothetical protein LBM08_09965 [Dysgonamonadaceae bacterium]|jgi:hypothetical protein|nr:hypothetical protein [Dysgonamonadaceae bacterium]
MKIDGYKTDGSVPVFLLFMFLLLALNSCDSGDIYPSGKTDKNDYISVSGTFTLLRTDIVIPGYQLIFGAFEENNPLPIVWTTVIDPKDDEEIKVSLSSVPPQASSVKLCLFTIGRRAIYDFYVYDIATATASVEIHPETPVSLMLEYRKIQEIFDSNCTSCHETAPGAAGLCLGTGASYTNLVNREATNSPKLRVKPHDVRNSFLMDVLTVDTVNLSHPHRQILYTDETNLLQAWIETGAENN